MDPQLKARWDSLALEIYEAGKRDGSAEMRKALLKLVGADSSPGEPSAAPPSLTERETGSSRAPRGALRDAIERALRERPGQTEQELQVYVGQLDRRVSPRSVGGELRRLKGDRYRQEGRKWFLLTEDPAGTG